MLSAVSSTVEDMSYRDLYGKQTLVWAAVAVGARMPVAMAPLALVFLARERPGGYTLGALLATAFVLGEIVGAPLLGMRLRPERARLEFVAGLAVGAFGFAGLGVFPDAHPAVLAGFAFVAGGAPAAVPGGLRTLLTGLVPERSVAKALSTESVLVSLIWAVAPAAVAALALGVAPRIPLLLAAALMASAVAGLWLLPVGWDADATDRGGEPMLRIMARAWPVYITGAANLALLALAELVLPALLEQRGIAVGWAGPLLAGTAVGSTVGAFVYGLRDWPGRLPTQSLVLLSGVSVCVTLVVLIPALAWLAVGLFLAGTLQGSAMITRNLTLRAALPPSAVAAGYSVMYAAVSAGYAVTGSLAGALLRFVEPSTVILVGAGLLLTMTVIGALGERKVLAGRAVKPAPVASTPVADGGAAGPEGTPVRGGGDAEHRL